MRGRSVALVSLVFDNVAQTDHTFQCVVPARRGTRHTEHLISDSRESIGARHIDSLESIEPLHPSNNDHWVMLPSFCEPAHQKQCSSTDSEHHMKQ